MLILEAGKVCQYGHRCPYNRMNECWGAKSSRNVTFTCSYVKDGQILEGGFRSPHDKTGRMTILNE